MKEYVTLQVQGARQRGRPRKTWKKVFFKAMDDLHIKLSDAMDCSKWCEMIRGNWSNSNSNSDSDAVS